MRKSSRVLIVMSNDWIGAAVEELRDLNLELVLANDCQAALRRLRMRPPIDLVLTAAILTDGTWRDVLRYAARIRRRPEVVVGARLGDASL